jgi:hypothetical protein
VTSLLRYFFVGAEIENQEVMGHGLCIAKMGGGWLGVGGVGGEMWVIKGATVAMEIIVQD